MKVMVMTLIAAMVMVWIIRMMIGTTQYLYCRIHCAQILNDLRYNVAFHSRARDDFGAALDVNS